MKEITLTNPFEGHGHLRRLATLMLEVIEYTIRQFSGMIVMPNVAVKELNLPHIIDLKKLLDYRKELIGVLRGLGQKSNFMPCFTYYLSPQLTVHDLLFAWENNLITGVKSYPEGATTGSDMGLGSFNEVTKILEVMEKHGIPLLIHGETPKWKGDVVEDLKREPLFFNEEA
ncbi:MAG: hypothetical protein WDN09_01215 [bacterium]